jgi:soluble lytic murein transglycosylase-like protein
MSIEATVARVAEIEQMLGASAGPTAAPSQAQGFQSQLAQASMASPVGAGASVATPGAPSGPGAPTPFAAEIDAAAARNGVDPALLRGLIKAESNFNPRAGSAAGAQGLTQLMPATARGLGVTNPFDPGQSIEGGAKYLREQLDKFGGDPEKALAAYNAGPGAVQRYGGVPPYPETQAYVKHVLEYARGYGMRSGATTSALPAGVA